MLQFRNPTQLAKPFGPYSYLAIVTGADFSTVYISGLTSRDAEGAIVAPHDFSGQVERIFANMSNALKDIGLGMDSVCELTIYSTVMDDYKSINESKTKWLSFPYPASTWVGVSSLNDERLCVEIKATAVGKIGN